MHWGNGDMTELGRRFLDCFVLAMNDGLQQHAYPSRVRFELADNGVSGMTAEVMPRVRTGASAGLTLA